MVERCLGMLSLLRRVRHYAQKVVRAASTPILQGPCRAGGPEEIRADLATLERIHECAFRPVWFPSGAWTCISCRGAAPAGTLQPRTVPELRCRPLPVPSIRCRRSGRLLV